MGAWQAKKKLNSVVPQVSDSITEEVSIALPTTPISCKDVSIFPSPAVNEISYL